jgi:hypothetical protein
MSPSGFMANISNVAQSVDMFDMNNSMKRQNQTQGGNRLKPLFKKPDSNIVNTTYRGKKTVRSLLQTSTHSAHSDKGADMMPSDAQAAASQELAGLYSSTHDSAAVHPGQLSQPDGILRLPMNNLVKSTRRAFQLNAAKNVRYSTNNIYPPGPKSGYTTVASSKQKIKSNQQLMRLKSPETESTARHKAIPEALTARKHSHMAANAARTQRNGAKFENLML